MCSFTSLAHFWPPPIFHSGYACVGCTVLTACFYDTAQRGLVLSPAGFLNPLCAEVLSVRRALFHLVTTVRLSVTLIQTAVHHISYMTVSLLVLTPISSETDFFSHRS